MYIDVHFKGFIIDHMRRDSQAQHRFFIFHIDLSVFDGLEGNVLTAFDIGRLIVQGGNGRARQNIEFALVLERRKLCGQQDVPDVLVNKPQRKGVKAAQRLAGKSTTVPELGSTAVPTVPPSAPLSLPVPKPTPVPLPERTRPPHWMPSSRATSLLASTI